MEIEKKYLLSELPKIRMNSEDTIKQGYIFTSNGEMRVRQKGNRFFLTVKSDGNLTRQEWEEEIPAWVFETLWLQTEGRRVEKTRFSISFNTTVLEFDEYYGELEGLFTLECEFANEQAAGQFTLPEWVENAVDITANKAYKNKNLAVVGLPS
jgi:adenylate cyclase